MQSPGPSHQNQLYKVLVIGDYAVGKTSIIKRYTEGHFSSNYKLTIGVDFAVKEITVDEDTKVTLQLWDVAGHERFGTMTRVYYKYAIAAIIVYDLTRPATFDAVVRWKDDLVSKVALPNGENIPLLLFANKCDIEGVRIDKEELDQYVADHGFLAWYPTSAATNNSIDDAMGFLVGKILEVAKENHPVGGSEQESISLGDTPNVNAGVVSAPAPRQPVKEEESSCCSF